VLRGKRGAVYPTAFLDQVDERRERSARKIAVPHARECEPRALHREEHRDDIAEHVSDGRVCHHRPITFKIAPAVENPAEYQKKKKISEVGELHEFVQRRVRQALQPQRRIHTCQPLIERDQLGVLPAGVTRCTSLPISSKQKEKTDVGTSAARSARTSSNA